MSAVEPKPSPLKRALFNAPVLTILLIVLLYGTGEKSHARLQHLGESLWSGYFQMRVDPVKPDCDPNAAPVAAAPDEEDDDLDDLLGDDEEEESSETSEGSSGEDDDLDDLLGDDEEVNEDQDFDYNYSYYYCN